MAGNSTNSVIAGIVANILVTIAKFIGFGFSGSAALLSEAIHSCADTANQALLLVGLGRAKRPADEAHPFGYGRDRFFWGLVSALGIFFVGAGVTIYHGIDGLLDPHHVHHTWVTWLVLAIAFVLEVGATWIAFVGVKGQAKEVGMSFSKFLKSGHDPTILAVLLEDSAAVLGVIIAAACILLGEVTGQFFWDPLASILIGVLLAFVAVFLIAKNRAYLITRSIDIEVADKVKGIITGHDSVEEITEFRGTVASLGSYRITADIDFDGHKLAEKVLGETDVDALHASLSDPVAFRKYLGDFAHLITEQVGDEIDEIEDKIKADVPEAHAIDLEQD